MTEGVSAAETGGDRAQQWTAYIDPHGGGIIRLRADSEAALYRKVAKEFCLSYPEEVLDRNREDFQAAIDAADWEEVVSLFFEDSRHGMDPEWNGIPSALEAHFGGRMNAG